MFILVVAGFALHTPPKKLYPATVETVPEGERYNQYNWYERWAHADCGELDNLILRMEAWLNYSWKKNHIWYVVEDEVALMKRVRKSNCRDA